ncbi:MAG: bifunctional UDP-N-acetylmuramoyl-tripeptide:D-alanyl-D-alanine ligase/alanine racemase [Saprospiraceae bacterium]|nr:bifunctional UDP-N-acetylmuramoyl-tripeptide:D-alanyl-D-alanine ligase/alanine racemase [Saprospiraceae bacterium]
MNIPTHTLSLICQWIDARWVQKNDPAAAIELLLLDSRGISAPTAALFFALPGQRHDGHRYLADAYRAGVRNFVVSRSIDPDVLPEANVLLVADSLLALQTLAARHRATFEIPVIGITGSNGKTVVKEWLYQLLHREYQVVRSPKSYNSQVGVPLSVWQMRPRHTLGIFEAGISQRHEMERLAHIIAPNIGIFTNIGPAHQEGFGSLREKVAEKMLLFAAAQTLVFCADHPEIATAAAAWANEKTGRTLVSWSKENRPASLSFSGFQTLPGGQTAFSLQRSGAPADEATECRIPYSDAASLENACHCIALLWHLGIPAARLSRRLRQLEPVEMRLELKAGINRCTVINDAYSNDLASLRIALQFAGQQLRGSRLTLILSDFLQSGQRQSALYAQVAKTLVEYKVGRLIGIGTEIPALRADLPATIESRFFADTDQFLQGAQWHDFHDELVLIKGARAFAFERIAHRLAQKAHKTVLEVNLSALVHNLNVYNRLLTPGTRMMVMVKAAGYGSGSAEIAKLLEFHQVDYLGVAYADEGIELRQAGVRLPVLVLNPEPASFDALFRYRLEPEVYSLSLLDELLAFAGKDKELAIHLKLDTGMHRLGFVPADIPLLCERLRRHPKVQVRTVFSHLAASDASGHDAFTHQQAAAFSAMYDAIQQALGYRPLRHICNTGGIARFPEYHYDMVRLGIGLYGLDSSGLQPQLQVVNTLKATISQVKEISPGETVGYNRNGPVTHPSRIATISIGYADGFLRLAGNGRYPVLVHGHRAPTIGNVCMDMTMVDVTDIPEAREGDEVVVFGEHLPVQELAACLQTIPYEVFTNISERVKRVYWQE